MLKLYSIEIVYPDTPELGSLAVRLKKELDSYRIPASVVKKTGIKSLADVTEPWLVVLCQAVILVTTVYSGVEYFLKNKAVFKS